MKSTHGQNTSYIKDSVIDAWKIDTMNEQRFRAAREMYINDAAKLGGALIGI